MRVLALKVPPSVPEETFDRLLHHLPEAGQVRVRKFRHEADAIRSLAGRLLPTWYLREEGLVSPPAHPRYAHRARGKPYLADPPVPGLDFNTSHEGEYVLLAAVRGPGADVGVDVMDLPEDPEQLAASIDFQLTPHERLLVAKCSGRVKAKMLTTLWTVKEGFTKATGEGISAGLDRIAVDLGDGTVNGVSVDGRDVREDGWRWAVGSLDAGAYGYAVVWRGEVVSEDVSVEAISWERFVKAFIGSE